MNVCLFYHSLVSDWNHGNAHFLRGIVSELMAKGHHVRVFEPREGWSRQNLLHEHGGDAVAAFHQAYPRQHSELYDPAALDLDAALAEADLVIVHEWNEHHLVRRLGQHRARSGQYVLLFHDTHHRAVTDAKSMSAYDLSHYDGVLAYGNVLRDLYMQCGWAPRAWTWHEAADPRVFKPMPNVAKEGDLIWVGNWGDEERAAELREFLIEPVKDLKLRARVHGVRYPAPALAALADAGIEYGGWLANFDAPREYAKFALTVHVPRRPYVESLPGIPTIRVFEALACGIPLICSPWNDVEHLFEPGRDYLVAHSGAEMRGQIRRLLDDPSAAVTMASHGRETIFARHTCAHRVEELLNICDQARRMVVKPAPGASLRRNGQASAGFASAAPASGPDGVPHSSASAAAGARTRGAMDIAFFGSSLVSAYWNGAATYYRGLLKALHDRGHRITFYEPDAYSRQQHRDIDDPPWARVVVYPADDESHVRECLKEAQAADLIVKASGVGVFDALLEAEVLELKRAGNIVAFWDVDAPATLDRIAKNPADAFKPLISRYDVIFTFGGGEPVVSAYLKLGARRCAPIYNALDPATHHPAPPDERFAGHLGFLGNRMPDREARVEEFFFKAADVLPNRLFLIGGNGWADRPLPANVRNVGHVYTRDHNAFNCTPMAVLNINRQSMASYGFSPATRVFEAAGAGACLITDAFKGVEQFLEPLSEILVAQTGEEVAEIVQSLTLDGARRIGAAAMRRVLAGHTYRHRAAEVGAVLAGAEASHHAAKAAPLAMEEA